MSGKKLKTNVTGLSSHLDVSACFCFCCLLFIPEATPLYKNNWTEIGVYNWKRALEKMREHESIDIHVLAAFKYSTFISGQNIKEGFPRSAKNARMSMFLSSAINVVIFTTLSTRWNNYTLGFFVQMLLLKR